MFNILSVLGIQDIYANATSTIPNLTASHAGPPAPSGGIISLLPTLIIFALVFYFLLIRPQTKKAKEQRKLMDSIAIKDEVLTTGGVIGEVVRVADNYVVLKLAENIEVVFQKSAIGMVLPKGTLQSI